MRLDELDEQMESLFEIIKPIVERPKKEILAELEPLENIQLQVALAYSMNTFLQAYLRLQGAAPRDHPIHRDMNRMKGFQQKLSEIHRKSPELKDLNLKAEETVRFASSSGNESFAKD